MGPPKTRRLTASWLTPACSSRCSIGVPIRASKLPGSRTASPVMVTTREISGVPSKTACATATAVPMFWHITPISAGMPPLGTSMPVSCFSPPDGYLVGTTAISVWVPSVAFRSAAMASGLLSSIPITQRSGRRIQAMIFRPATTSSAFSRMVMSSAVM